MDTFAYDSLRFVTFLISTTAPVDLTSTTCGSIPSTETGSCISNGLPRSASSGLKTVCHVSKQGIDLRGVCTFVITSQIVDGYVLSANPMLLQSCLMSLNV